MRRDTPTLMKALTIAACKSNKASIDNIRRQSTARDIVSWKETLPTDDRIDKFSGVFAVDRGSFVNEGHGLKQDWRASKEGRRLAQAKAGLVTGLQRYSYLSCRPQPARGQNCSFVQPETSLPPQSTCLYKIMLRRRGCKLTPRICRRGLCVHSSRAANRSTGCTESIVL
jgi:hypothetical protein